MPMTSCPVGQSARRVLTTELCGPGGRVSSGLSVLQMAEVCQILGRAASSTVTLDQILPGVWVLDAESLMTVSQLPDKSKVSFSDGASYLFIDQDKTIAGGRLAECDEFVITSEDVSGDPSFVFNNAGEILRVNPS
jgi:hypothetical protein